MARYSYLTMNTGSRVGANFLLDPEGENHIGRGLECSIVVTDALCSRVHVRFRQDDGAWHLEDAESRNGTFVNGQKAHEARLADGNLVRVGSTEFTFHESSDVPTMGGFGGTDFTQEIIKDQIVDPSDTGGFAIGALADPRQAQELLLLYQLSIKLLGCEDPDRVVREVLEFLHERLEATLAGFLWVNEQLELKSKLLLPDGIGDDVKLSESLTKLVFEQGHAIWIADQRSADASESLRHYADAICVPLVDSEATLGALHVYRQNERFRQHEFDLALSLANILTVALKRARRQATLTSDLERLVSQSPGYDELVGESLPMQELKDKMSRLARATGCVLVRGESGTGKELVARGIHRQSPRVDRPLLSVNCAAIPESLMESQLFGHKTGAFTGADRDHIGYFQQADLGTLFLDEVGDMTLGGQAKLLRILEGHPFHPVGGTEEITVDVRVIAATNQDLEQCVREKKFREDLYYRLSVFELYIPPLRERGGDIEALVEFFLDHYSKQHGRPSLTLSKAAREALLSYNWPGNVRQLRNVIDSAVVMAAGEIIEPGGLGLRPHADQPALESLKLDFWEQKLIGEALERTSGNVSEAAQLLGIGRATLYRKLDEYGIKR